MTTGERSVRSGGGGKPEFEWDPEKAQANYQKHRVSIDEASTVFADPLGRLVDDPEHSAHEVRYLPFGHTTAGRLLAVIHTEREGAIRLISERKMTRNARNEQ